MAWTIADSGVASVPDGNAGHVYTYPGGAPASGNLCIICVTSDTTVSTPTGYTVAASDVHNAGVYMFYRVADGSEGTSTTITTSGNAPTEMGWLRYRGISSAAFDQTVKAFNVTGGQNSNTATTPALTTTGELVVAFVGNHSLAAGTPTSPVWSSGYTNRLTGDTGGTGITDGALFIADTYNAGTAAESPSVSWTNAVHDTTILVGTFSGTPVADFTANPYGTTFVAELNRLANGGTYPALNTYLDEAGAANKWAGTTGLQTVGALNAKNGGTLLELQGVCNALGNTSGLGVVAAIANRAA